MATLNMWNGSAWEVVSGAPGESGTDLSTLVDAAGDLLVGTADNTLGRLGMGSALNVLQVNSGGTALEWAANPLTAHEAAGDPHTGYLQESVISALATPAIVLGTAAAAGTGTTPIRHNSTIAAFDATVPTTIAYGAAAATGSVAFAARRDHTHGMVAAPHTHDGTGGATSLIVGGTNEAGATIPVASSAGSIAIGDFANAGTSTQPIAIGSGVSATSAPSATAQGAIAIGASNATATAGARASGTASIALGSGTTSINVGASASGFGSTAIGTWAACAGAQGVAVGVAAIASATDAVAIGDTANATTIGAVAFGAFAQATTGNQAVAIGGGTGSTSAPNATAQGGIAIGASSGAIAGARASGISSIAIGSGDGTITGASASAADTLALGRKSVASIIQGIAIGSFAGAITGAEAIAIGSGVSATAAPQANAQGAIAIGASNASGVAGAKASGVGAIAIGSGDATNPGANSGGIGAIAIGHRSSTATASSAIAIGVLSSASDIRGIAIGETATCAHANSAALGRAATTTAINQIMLGTVTEQVYVPGTFRIPTGGGAGKVLTSDANGVGSWAAATGGTTIDQQVDAPAGPVTGDLWLDTDESAGVGLSSIIGYAEVTANQGSITTEVDLTGLAVNVTVPAGRRIQISAVAPGSSSVVGDTGRVTIKDELNANLQSGRVTYSVAGRNETHIATAIVSPSAGAHTYRLAMARSAGTGTVTMGAGVGEPAFILVEDITGTLWPAGQSIGAGTIANEAWTAFTATPVPTGGTFTTASGVGAYIKMGRTVTLRYAATITTVGSATGDIRFVPPIPFSTTDLFYFGSGRESGLTGDDLRAFWPGGVDPTKIQIAGSTLASGKIYAVAFSYEAAS